MNRFVRLQQHAGAAAAVAAKRHHVGQPSDGDVRRHFQLPAQLVDQLLRAAVQREESGADRSLRVDRERRDVGRAAQAPVALGGARGVRFAAVKRRLGAKQRAQRSDWRVEQGAKQHRAVLVLKASDARQTAAHRKSATVATENTMHHGRTKNTGRFFTNNLRKSKKIQKN